MLVMETIRKIRVRHRNGESIRKISRDMHISRNTTRKFLRSGELKDPSYTRIKTNYPQLGPYIDEVNQLLKEDRKAPRTRTMRSIYEILEDRGFKGSYSAVCKYIRRVQEERSSASCKGAFIPLHFESGEAYQFDWSTQVIQLGCEMVKIKVAHFVLCYSRMKFSYAYPCETQEMVFDAHVRAFEYFGGIPRRGIYDNMKTAVQKILKGKQRDWNPAFERLCAHYRVEPTACNPASGWEKGQVERQVQADRTQFFTPIPKVNSLSELNEQLLSQVVVRNQTHRHPTLKDKTIEEVYKEEKPNLAPLPVQFDGTRSKEVKVSSTCLAMFDRNHYSVDCHYAGKLIQCKAYADKLVFIYHGKQIASHQRHFTRGQTYYNWRHYLPVLIRKPGALRNGAPFKQMALPGELETVQKHLQCRPSGAKEFIQILSYIPEISMEAVQNACREAIKGNTISSDVILNYLLRSQQEPESQDTPVVPSHLVLHHVPTSNCDRYNQLLTEVQS